MIHYYIIFHSYLPKLNSQLFSYQIWAGRKSQFFFQGQISRIVLCYMYAYSITVLHLNIFFLMCTVDGRNPVPPGWYYFWSGAVSTIRSWTHTNEQENPGSVRTRSFFHFFSIFWLCMKSGPRDWIHLLFQRIRCQDSHVRSTITRKRRWLNHHHQRRKLCTSSLSRHQKRRSPRCNPYKMWPSHWHPGWSKCHIPSYVCCIYVVFWICIACVYL